MLQAFKRFVRDRLGAASHDDVAAMHKAVRRSEERVVDAVVRQSRQLAKRLDRLEQRMAALAGQTAALDAIARTGRLRKIDDNVDALVRHTFLDGHLPEPQRLLARRFRGLSQHEEDGILVALFDRIGAANRRFVEIGAGVNGGNSGFLARECGWTGVMMEIDPDRVSTLQRRFGRGVSVVQAQVTRDNVNDLVSDHGLSGDIDLVSIDIDGIDYWVWEQLSACRPRLVVVEYNPFFGSERSVAVPYDPMFDRRRFDVPRTAYYGASLPALVRLGERKGYRPVVVEPRGVNAFFVRTDVLLDLPTLRIGDMPIAPEAAPDFGAGGIFGLLERAGLRLVEIE